MQDEIIHKGTELRLKDSGPAGTVVAKFASLNEVDKDGDVTLPGAFGDQEVRLSAWGHAWGELPVGRGAITEKGDDAIFDGEFFMQTAHGRDAYETVKGLGDLQEWSYGFRILDASEETRDGEPVRLLKGLKVIEVSPVMEGAGNDTRTLAMKAMRAVQDQEPYAGIDLMAFLKGMRQDRDMTDEELGDAAAMVESIDRLKAFADRLGVPVMSFFDKPVESKPEEKPEDEPVKDDPDAALYESFKSTSEKFDELMAPDPEMSVAFDEFLRINARHSGVEV